jgi:hypothetical protein
MIDAGAGLTGQHPDRRPAICDVIEVGVGPGTNGPAGARANALFWKLWP